MRRVTAVLAVSTIGLANLPLPAEAFGRVGPVRTTSSFLPARAPSLLRTTPHGASHECAHHNLQQTNASSVNSFEPRESGARVRQTQQLWSIDPKLVETTDLNSDPALEPPTPPNDEPRPDESSGRWFPRLSISERGRVGFKVKAAFEAVVAAAAGYTATAQAMTSSITNPASLAPGSCAFGILSLQESIKAG